jgi:hypothetical protein
MEQQKVVGAFGHIGPQMRSDADLLREAVDIMADAVVSWGLCKNDKQRLEQAGQDIEFMRAFMEDYAAEELKEKREKVGQL